MVARLPRPVETNEYLRLYAKRISFSFGELLRQEENITIGTETLSAILREGVEICITNGCFITC